MADKMGRGAKLTPWCQCNNSNRVWVLYSPIFRTPYSRWIAGKWGNSRERGKGTRGIGEGNETDWTEEEEGHQRKRKGRSRKWEAPALKVGTQNCLSAATGTSVQRHPQRRKILHGNHRGTKI